MMGIKDAVKGIFGEEEPPKFADFTPEQLYELIDYFENKKKKIEEELNANLWQIDIEEEDYSKSVRAHYKQRKEKLIAETRKKIMEFQKLVDTMYLRLGPGGGK